MIGLSTLIVLGPCLIMAMAALALVIVALGLNRTGHALVWAIGCGLGALQWGVMAAQGIWSGHQLHSGLIVNLLGMAGAILLAEGFRMRRWRERGRGVLFGAGGIGLAALVIAATVPHLPLRAAITPILSIGLFGWSAGTVVHTASRPSATEATVAAVLLAIALVHVAGAVLAIAEQVGLIPDHRFYTALYMTAAAPASAGVSFAALMLIAYDYSVELRRLLHTDPLTGILNRQGFDDAVQAAFGRSRSRRLTLALADIDHFKQVNDDYGHPVGDATLARVAERLAGAIGREGIVARIGGEEFAILLPGLDGAGSVSRMEAVRQQLRPSAPADPQVIEPTLSFGLAERLPGEGMVELMERADAALYRSKREGRDRCTLAPDGTAAS